MERRNASASTAVVPATPWDALAAAGEDWQRSGLVQEEAERELLGLALSDATLPEHLAGGYFEEMANALKPADFAIPLHRAAFTSMLRVGERGLRPDLLALEADLRGREGYGVGDIAALTLGVYDSANRGRFTDLVNTVKEAAARRRGTLLTGKIAAALADRDVSPEEAMERGIRALHAVRDDYTAALGGADDTIGNVVADYRRMVEGWKATPGALRGTTTGLAVLDHETRGVHLGDLWVIGARMSMAKTALMLSMALGAARNCGAGHQVGIISLEMRKTAILHRLASMLSGQSATAIEDGDASVDWDAVDAALAELELLPIRIIDAQGAARKTNGSRGKMTVDEIARHARAWHQAARLDALYIDYLELITPRKDDAKQSRDLQVGGNAIALKALASELDIPVVLLCQLNRETDKRASHIPTLSDLRYSDEIAAVADVVLFPVRWDYYRERGQEVPEEGKDKPRGAMDLWIAKQRNRAVSMAQAFYLKERMQVVDFDEKRKVPVDYHGNVIPQVVSQADFAPRGRR